MASGDTLVTFDALAGRLPSSGGGGLDTRNGHPVIDLAVGEKVIFSAILPRHYDGGGLTVREHYAMSSAVANDIKLQTDLERIGDQQQDLDSDGFTGSPQNTGDVTVPGTSGLVDIVTTAHTAGAQMDNLAVGEAFRLQVQRVAVAGTDASGDLELLAVEVKET